MVQPIDHQTGPAQSSAVRVSGRLAQPARSTRSYATSQAEDFDLMATEAGLVQIEGYDDDGFIVNDVGVEGSLLCSGDIYTLWDIHQLEDITSESLAMLVIIKPPPDLLIIGCGRRTQMVPQQLHEFLTSNNISVEALDTPNAVSTFNILNKEGRKVAGALLPAAVP
ncbi:hypothetical protein WJX72_002868 [[Myrmecia] bisecta]|uniref:NADH dehydrogenase [ubiquinone] 1 alpha subcomplex assembly factor 3 n=1 Tax=[Myrmecia] bisecta TaxID=41462 RepID=A0AAW1PWG0_9CHLO